MLQHFKRRGLLLLIIGVVAAVLIASYAKLHRPRQAAGAAQQKATQPEYAAVASGRVDIDGGIISVAARRPGTIRAVFVQEGDLVKTGQILAQQDDTDARLAVAGNRAGVLQAQSKIASLRVTLSAARRELARIEPLLQAGYVSNQRLDVATDQIRSAEADVDTQKAALTAAEAELRQAEYDLELTTIRAPVDGVVVRRYANPGVGASTLNVSNMFDIQPDADLIVRAEVDEATLPLVTIGQAVDVSPEAGGATFRGQVLRRGAMFGSRTLRGEQSDETDERVVTVIVGIGRARLLVGQRVIVRFLHPCPAKSRGVPARRVAAVGLAGDGGCR